MDTDETPLTGGRVTSGIVKIGETVRRSLVTDRSPVHGLLLYLEAQGFDAAPRFLGIDERQREMLDFIPGDVPANLGRYDDDALAAAARLLRRFHDATVDFPPVRESGAQVMCHNDWGRRTPSFVTAFPAQ